MNNFHKPSTILLLMVLLIPVAVYAAQINVESASQEQVALIGVLLNPDVVVTKSAAIKSTNHKRAHYVGLNFTVSGIPDTQTGVWLVSGEKNEPKGVLAVDGFAQQFSRATAADKTNPPTASSVDNECKKLKKHLRPPKSK